MPYFRYRAIDESGRLVKGLAEASDPSAIESSIRGAGQYPLMIKKINPWLGQFIGLFRGRVKRKDIIEFSNNLSVMLKAGIPLLTALEDIASTTENKYFREKILAISKMVQMGSTFSDAIEAHRDIFPDIFVRLVRVGEETGRLDQSLKDISEHLQRIEALTSAVKRSLIYPIFTIVATLSAMAFWLIYVLPKLANLFREMNLSLPLITRIIMGVSDFTRQNWLFIVFTPFLIFMLYKLLTKNRRIRFRCDKMKFSLPVIRLIVHNKILAIFSEQMRILLIAGIGIDRVFEIVAEVLGNYYAKEAVLVVREDVLAGASISEALRKHDVFPLMLVRMVHVGEQTGALDEQFSFLSEYFINALEDISQKIGKLLEPIVIVILGLFFIFIILGLLIPVYDLVSKIGMGG
jgi:type II secretory pathway component PulF